MTNASAVRIIQDTCCPAAWIVARAENIFHNAIAEAILDDHWLTIVIKHPHAEETNASGCVTINRVVDSKAK